MPSKSDKELILMPGGANGDLVPALRLIRSLNYSTRVVLGVRDIIDDPAVTCAVWQREGFYDTLRRYYDFRNHTPGTPALETDAFLVHSDDQGATWQETRLTAVSFDLRTAPV